MRRVAAMFVAGIAGALPAATAEGQGNPAPKDWCFRGRPAAFCRSFWLTEVGQYWRLGGSGFVESYPDASFHRNHLGSHLTWEIGAMANRGPTAALGATVLLGTDNRGTRLGVKGRYRRWFGSRGGTLDLSGGALKAVAAGSFPDFSRPAYGATADLSLGWGDWVAGTARADLLRRNDGQMVNAAYAGVRLGSYPAVVATVAGAVVVALAIAAFLGGGDF